MAINSPDQVQTPQFEAVGRLLDTEWFSNFQQVFSDVAQRHDATLIPRINPGVLYLEGREVAAAAATNPLLEGVTDTSSAIDRLIEQEVLDEELATSSLSLALRFFDIRSERTRRDVLRIRVRVGHPDLRVDSSNPIVTKEKLALYSSVGILRKDQMAQVNGEGGLKHYASLGVILDPNHRIHKGHMNNIERDLDAHVTIGPVSEIIGGLASEANA